MLNTRSQLELDLGELENECLGQKRQQAGSFSHWDEDPPRFKHAIGSSLYSQFG
jgi:hypothetical protein